MRWMADQIDGPDEDAAGEPNEGCDENNDVDARPNEPYGLEYAGKLPLIFMPGPRAQRSTVLPEG